MVDSADRDFDRATRPWQRTDLLVMSATSCAAAACHGGAHPGIAQPSAARGAEYPLWQSRDPHARSWQTLCSSQSVDMLRRLHIMVDGQIVDRDGFDNCLACHNTTRRFREPRSDVAIQEGVGCAACHGPAELWLHQHYRDARLSAVPECGFVDNRDLLTRARMCASCHVGDADRDMNHDLIAAGHPALNYEFATYHARYPKHWREENPPDASRWEAQLWLVGQLAGLDASLTLLEARARQRLPVSTWPELAEHNCASCHQELAVPRLEQKSVSPGIPSAAWHRAGLEQLLAYRAATSVTGTDLQLQAALADVQQTLEASRVPDPQAAAAAAGRARDALSQWLQTARHDGTLSQFDARQLLQIVEHNRDRPATLHSWDTAAQWYLSLIAAPHRLAR